MMRVLTLAALAALPLVQGFMPKAAHMTRTRVVAAAAGINLVETEEEKAIKANPDKFLDEELSIPFDKASAAIIEYMEGVPEAQQTRLCSNKNAEERSLEQKRSKMSPEVAEADQLAAMKTFLMTAKSSILADCPKGCIEEEDPYADDAVEAEEKVEAPAANSV